MVRDDCWGESRDHHYLLTKQNQHWHSKGDCYKAWLFRTDITLKMIETSNKPERRQENAGLVRKIENRRISPKAKRRGEAVFEHSRNMLESSLNLPGA
jgi:hypothetical protein